MSNVRFTLTIATGATTSNVLIDSQLKNFHKFVLYAPATAPSGTVTLEVSAVDGAIAVAGDWRTFTATGWTIPAADQATPYNAAGFRGVRLSTTVAPGADENWDFVGEEVESY